MAVALFSSEADDGCGAEGEVRPLQHIQSTTQHVSSIYMDDRLHTGIHVLLSEPPQDLVQAGCQLDTTEASLNSLVQALFIIKIG